MELAIYEKASNEVKTTVSEMEKSLFFISNLDYIL